jgi:catechol 1,2-dioxygenase
VQRRNFITQSGLIAIGLAAYGNISWRNGRYIGDSPTTTDILGPFYRPGAPFRVNLNPNGFTGEVLHLSGTIYQYDGKTPAPGCLLEIWQCQQDGLYDNVSDDYTYRASQKTGVQGKYRFTTSIPIPYPSEGNPQVMRPAHIHMRISAPRSAGPHHSNLFARRSKSIRRSQYQIASEFSTDS